MDAAACLFMKVPPYPLRKKRRNKGEKREAQPDILGHTPRLFPQIQVCNCGKTLTFFNEGEAITASTSHS